MPSQAWPVVGGCGSSSWRCAMINPPAAASSRPRRNARGCAGAARRTAPRRRSRRTPAATTWSPDRRSMLRSSGHLVASAQVGFVVVELEVDQRAEHLQIGDERVHLGQAGAAVEIAREGFGIALMENAGAGVVGIGLGAQICGGALDLLLGVGNADRAIGPHVAGNARPLGLGLGQARLGG